MPNLSSLIASDLTALDNSTVPNMDGYIQITMNNCNISDISFLLGYSEAGYFCKIFKKYEGETPSAFARIVKK